MAARIVIGRDLKLVFGDDGQVLLCRQLALAKALAGDSRRHSVLAVPPSWLCPEKFSEVVIARPAKQEMCRLGSSQTARVYVVARPRNGQVVPARPAGALREAREAAAWWRGQPGATPRGALSQRRRGR